MAPKISRSQALEPVNIPYTAKGPCKSDEGENLEIRRVGWILQVGLKCNHKCLDKREAKGDSSPKEKRKPANPKSEIGGMQPQDKECWQTRGAGGSKAQVLPCGKLESALQVNLDFQPLKVHSIFSSRQESKPDNSRE